MRKRYGAGRDLHYKVVQYAHDWIMLESGTGSKAIIVTPTGVEFDDIEELLDFVDAGHHSGMFWDIYEIHGLRLKLKSRLVDGKASDLSL